MELLIFDYTPRIQILHHLAYYEVLRNRWRNSSNIHSYRYYRLNIELWNYRPIPCIVDIPHLDIPPYLIYRHTWYTAILDIPPYLIYRQLDLKHMSSLTITDMLDIHMLYLHRSKRLGPNPGNITRVYPYV